MPVYCEDCEHYKCLGRCGHLNNLKADWESLRGFLVELASVINANNDCAWFEEKPTAIPEQDRVIRIEDPVTVSFNTPESRLTASEANALNPREDMKWIYSFPAFAFTVMAFVMFILGMIAGGL